MNFLVRERAPERNLTAFVRSNLRLLFQLFAWIAFASPLSRDLFLASYQASFPGVHTPKFSPELVQAPGFGHQLSCLALCAGSKGCKYDRKSLSPPGLAYLPTCKPPRSHVPPSQ